MRHRSRFAALALLAIAGCAGGQIHSTHFPFGGLWSVRNYQGATAQRAWLIFHPNKALACEQFYANGERTGTWRRFAPDETLLFERSYAADLPHGTWRRFRQDGSLIVTRTYENGELIDEVWATAPSSE
jgi:antitoxin component YwqK of YwqJK toxin-antitoxin module